jgi:hypothetical protein
MHVSEVVNPAGPTSPRVDAGAIIAAIEVVRRDGTATVEQAMQLMEANIAELEERLVQGGTPAETAMRSLVARLTEAPTNLHQAIVYFAGREPEHEDAGKAMASFLAGLAIVGAPVSDFLYPFLGYKAAPIRFFKFVWGLLAGTEDPKNEVLK